MWCIVPLRMNRPIFSIAKALFLGLERIGIVPLDHRYCKWPTPPPQDRRAALDRSAGGPLGSPMVTSTSGPMHYHQPGLCRAPGLTV